MEIKGDKHKHAGATSWHPISRKHKTNLHGSEEVEPDSEEDVVENNDELIPEPESMSVPDSTLETVKNPVRQDVVIDKRISFLSALRFQDTEVNIPQNAEWLYINFGAVENDESSPYRNIPNASWQMLLVDDLPISSPSIRVAPDNCVRLYYGRNYRRNVELSLSTNRNLLINGEADTFVNLRIKYE